MCSTLGYYTAQQQQQQQQQFNQSQLYQPPNTNFSIYKSSKISPTRRLKNLLKPLLRHIFKSKAKKPQRNSYIACEEKEAEFDWLHNDMDNRANEHLEQQLYDELYQSPNGAAIVVYDETGAHLEEIDKDNLYVPVHFARTNAGTFFWTSLQRETIDPLRIEWNFLDRWAQA